MSAAQRETPLARKLKERIRREGPILISEYMEACLADPEHGYYRTKGAIGAGGDFITAPEISQVFGELIGLWSVVVWQQMGGPSPVRLVELGPGRGTLIKDALRAARGVPEFLSAAGVHLVEISEPMRRQQEATLRDRTVPIAWSASLGDLPKGIPTILIANEYLDTLPVDQWVRAEGEWRARRIGVGADGAFEFVLGAGEPGVEELASRCPPPPDGAVLEARKFSELASCIGALIREAPAAGLFIDYGHVDCQFGDSLQAVRGQRYEHPLASPGEADVTCQVDFVDFGLQFRHHEITVDGPVTQAEFLGSLGVAERASRLMAANPDKAAAIEAAIARLMAPAGMGTRFKAIGVRSSRLPQLPGFAATN